jgi:hypothetical protein
MKAISLIPAVALLISACASGPSGVYSGYGGPGYYGGETVIERDNDHRSDNGGYDNGYNNRTNVTDVNVNRTNINENSVNRTSVTDSRANNKKSTVAVAGKRTVTRKSDSDSSSQVQVEQSH